MTYILTQKEKEIIDSLAQAYWADLQVMVYDGVVIMYVNSHRRDFDYPLIFKVCDNPEEVRQSILGYEGYQNRSLCSARRIREVFERHGYSGDMDIEESARQFLVNEGVIK